MFCDWAKGWRLYNRLDRGCYLQIHDDVPRAILTARSGWVNRQQQDVIDYLREENRVLRAGLRGKRLKLSNDDRRRWYAQWPRGTPFSPSHHLMAEAPRVAPWL